MASLSRRRTDFFVGTFILLAFIGIVFVALRAANITDVTADEGYVLTVRFENIGSLVTRAPVKSSGVRVGRVKDITYDNDRFIAKVDIIVEPQYRFPVDSIFSIVSSNLLGGQYIAIEVGGEEENLAEGAELRGNSALVLEELIGKFLFDKAGE